MQLDGFEITLCTKILSLDTGLQHCTIGWLKLKNFEEGLYVVLVNSVALVDNRVAPDWRAALRQKSSSVEITAKKQSTL